MAEKQTVDVLVEGGKAKPGPPIAPTLAPLGVNIVKIIEAINQKTKVFEGIQVPVKILVDKKTKEFEIVVGTPPASALIKKELGLEKGAKGEQGKKGKEVVGNLSIDQCIKLAKAKSFHNIKSGVKQILGTCFSMGVTVEGNNAKAMIKKIERGAFEDKLK